jgi:hypothetical protein
MTYRNELTVLSKRTMLRDGMSPAFSTTGGARLDGLNWTASFATLSGNKDELRLSVPEESMSFQKTMIFA